MRVAFAGTPRFAAEALAAILAAGFDVTLVLTQPDRPSGRGMTLQPGAVKRLAQARALSVFQPERLRDPSSWEPVEQARVDLMVVAAYGLILPSGLLTIPRLGCVNIHASLLPRWRGAAPIQRALLAGDGSTGVTIMQMDAGLDTGPMLRTQAVPITPRETTGSLHDKLASIGAGLIVEVLRELERGELTATPQPEQGVTYAPKIDKSEAAIDWRQPAESVDRMVRAFDPSPGAVARVRETPVKIWRAEPASDGGEPGEVLAAGAGGITVACGSGALRVVELQRQGGKRLSAGDFLRGFQVRAGDRFGLPAD